MIDFSKYKKQKVDFSKYRQAIQPKEEPQEEVPNFSKFRIVSLPEHLGGGQYYVGENGSLVTTKRDVPTSLKNQIRGGSFADTEMEVDHIMSKALGGTDDPSNLQALQNKKSLGQKIGSFFGKDYQVSQYKVRQEGKEPVEQQAIRDYKAGKISLNEARLAIATKQQQIKGLTPTEKEQDISPFLKGVEKFSNITNKIGDFLDITSKEDSARSIVSAIGEGLFSPEHRQERKLGFSKGVLQTQSAALATLNQLSKLINNNTIKRYTDKSFLSNLKADTPLSTGISALTHSNLEKEFE